MKIFTFSFPLKSLLAIPSSYTKDYYEYLRFIMTNPGKEENRIDEKINISKFPHSTTQYYKLNTDQDWVKKLLLELNEKSETKPIEDTLKETSIEINLELTKCFKHEYGEYMLVQGSISTEYITLCVRTLEEMKEKFELDFRTCFLHTRFDGDEAFGEELEIFEKDEMYEIYFFEKGHINIYEMIHEVIYLNLNQYPIKDSEAPLHWAKSESDTKQ